MLVVATAVGGIPEVLPPHIMRLASPDADALAAECVAAADECAARRLEGAPSKAPVAPRGRAKRGGQAIVAREDGVGSDGDDDDAEAQNAWRQHREVKAMYTWPDVAARVEAVYAKAAATSSTPLSRLRRYAATGTVSGILFAAVAVCDGLFMRLMEWVAPAASIDVCPDFQSAYVAHGTRA
jgi:phosphatidylinositol glycan class A protein